LILQVVIKVVFAILLMLDTNPTFMSAESVESSKMLGSSGSNNIDFFNSDTVNSSITY